MTERSYNTLAAAPLLVTLLLLVGCATSVGTPTDGSDFRDTYGYLPVNDRPPERQQPLLTSEEQAKLRAALTEARDHQSPGTAKRTSHDNGRPSPADLAQGPTMH